MKKIILFFLLIYGCYHSLMAQQFKVGIDYTLLTNPIEVSRYKDVIQSHINRSIPAFWASYTINDRWSALLKYHSYEQEILYKSKRTLMLTDITRSRKAAFVDVALGINLSKYIEALQSQKLSLWWYFGGRIYPGIGSGSLEIVSIKGQKSELIREESLSWESKGLTLRPMTQMMLQYQVHNLVFLSSSVSYAYTTLHMNPVILHVGIGAQF